MYIVKYLLIERPKQQVKQTKKISTSCKLDKQIHTTTDEEEKINSPTPNTTSSVSWKKLIIILLLNDSTK